MIRLSKHTIWLTVLALWLLGAAINSTSNRQRPTTNTPPRTPTPAINIALGGFRGIIADLLWLHAAELQEQGRYFALTQLASAITRLQPEFPEVWALQAWNMAYNISVLIPDPDQRWPWVRQGLELLRDEATLYNGFHPLLCAEVATILLHKVTGNIDEASDFYKFEWIELTTPLLDAKGHLTDDPAPFAIAFNMNPVILQQLDQQYGPFDWRLAASHAAYWTFLGRQAPPDAPGQGRCQRLFRQCMVILVAEGKLSLNPERTIMRLAPATDRIEPAIRTIDEIDEPTPAEQNALENLLIRSILLLAANQQNDKARKLYARLQSQFPSPANAVDYRTFTRNLPNLTPTIITKPNMEPQS